MLQTILLLFLLLGANPDSGPAHDYFPDGRLLSEDAKLDVAFRDMISRCFRRMGEEPLPRTQRDKDDVSTLRIYVGQACRPPFVLRVDFTGRTAHLTVRALGEGGFLPEELPVILNQRFRLTAEERSELQQLIRDARLTSLEGVTDLACDDGTLWVFETADQRGYSVAARWCNLTEAQALYNSILNLAERLTGVVLHHPEPAC